MTRKSELIKPDDVRYLKNALGSFSEEIKRPVTAITKDEITGQIVTLYQEDVKPLTPMQILENLCKISLAPNEHSGQDLKQEAAINIKTAAGLGAFALGLMVEEDKPYSVTRLKKIQRILDDINVDMYGTNLRSNLKIPGFVEALSYINSVVYRTWAKRQFAEKFEIEE